MAKSKKHNRLDKWEKMPYVLTFFYGEDEKKRKNIVELAKDKDYEGKPKAVDSDIIGACKELIFDIKDGIPVFHAIMYGFDTDKMSIKIQHFLDILVGKEKTQEEIDESVRHTLAVAVIEGIPVYPNNINVEDALIKYHRSMLIDGFTAPDGSGGQMRLMLTRSPRKKIDSHSYLKELKITETYSPADIALVKASVLKEFNRLDNTRKILGSLSSGINELSVCLKKRHRNENELQKCLTRNPILFGTDYARIIPKHKLGAEYEMDYALERVSGVYDLVEIESSTLPVFNKTGSPSHYLVHAEQQIMDWINWVECNNPYARNALPQLMRPVGFVVIGRSEGTDTQKLRHRNAIYRDQIKILTYDDLLAGARNLLRRLEGLGQADVCK